MSAKQAAFFISAHPDDWQLFMMPIAFHAMRDSFNKAVFIHITSGDAIGNITENASSRALANAREEGVLRTLRFMLSLKQPSVIFERASVLLNGKNLELHAAHNVVAYFLRLPDGNPEGTGCTMQQGQSLRYLRHGETDNLSATDRTAVYADWKDLVNTIHAIVNLESESANPIRLHSTDPSLEHNPNDHSDHYLCGNLAADVFDLKKGAELYFYAGYDVTHRPVNLVLPDLLLQVALWGVTNSAIVDAGLPTAFDETHNQWLGKSYVRNVIKNEDS